MTQKTSPNTAFVTGASGAIGSAIALALATAGYSLTLLGGSNQKKLDETAKACRDIGVPVYSTCVDFRKKELAAEKIEQTLSRLERVDLLVNCAGVSHIGLLTDMTGQEWEDVLSVNLSSAFYCCRSIVPYMVRQKSGQIIQISSVWGSAGASCEAAYSAAKGGIHAMTRALARELAPSGITVNAIACGMIDTPMNHCFSDDEIQSICEEIPAGRMGTPEEVAETVIAMTKMPVYMTGNILTLDGGWQ